MTNGSEKREGKGVGVEERISGESSQEGHCDSRQWSDKETARRKKDV